MTNENKMKAGVALALGALAEAEASIVVSHPNTTISGSSTGEYYLGIDPLNQTVMGCTDVEMVNGPYGAPLTLYYWCSGVFLDAGGQDYAEAMEVEETLAWAKDQGYTQEFIEEALSPYMYSGVCGGFFNSALQEGDVVSSSAEYDGGWSDHTMSRPPTNSYYLGFQVFSVENTNDCYYGYLKTTISLVDGDEGNIMSLTLDQLAYESEANTPITVGAVPEPSSSALMVLGFFLFRWVKRKARRR